MKKILMFCLVLLSARIAQAQFIVDFGAGLNDNPYVTANLELGYQMKGFHVNAGYLVPLTTYSTAPKLFLIRTGKGFVLGKGTKLDLSAGAALHNYMKTDKSLLNESFPIYKPVNVVKFLVTAGYEKMIIKDGAFTASVYYSGGVVFGGVGMKYFFKKKLKQAAAPKKEKK